MEWEESGIQIKGEYLSNFCFVDDIVLMSKSTDKLQQMILELHKNSQKVRLKMIMKESMVIFKNYILHHEIRIDNEVLECAQEYIYLGQNIGACPNYGTEIKRRIALEWSAFGRKHNVMKTNIPLSLERKVYNQYILPALTCESETWSLRKTPE